MPLSALDHGTGSGTELGFTLGEVGEARGILAVPSLALLALPVLLPGGPTVSYCRSRNPQAGPKQLKAPKTPLQGLAKVEFELGWEHPHSALPLVGLGCSTLEASLPLKITTTSQRPPQLPRDHHNLLKPPPP